MRVIRFDQPDNVDIINELKTLVPLDGSETMLGPLVVMVPAEIGNEAERYREFQQRVMSNVVDTTVFFLRDGTRSFEGSIRFTNVNISLNNNPLRPAAVGDIQAFYNEINITQYAFRNQDNVITGPLLLSDIDDGWQSFGFIPDDYTRVATRAVGNHFRNAVTAYHDLNNLMRKDTQYTLIPDARFTAPLQNFTEEHQAVSQGYVQSVSLGFSANNFLNTNRYDFMSVRLGIPLLPTPIVGQPDINTHALKAASLRNVLKYTHLHIREEKQVEAQWVIRRFENPLNTVNGIEHLWKQFAPLRGQTVSTETPEGGSVDVILPNTEAAENELGNYGRPVFIARKNAPYSPWLD